MRKNNNSYAQRVKITFLVHTPCVTPLRFNVSHAYTVVSHPCSEDN